MDDRSLAAQDRAAAARERAAAGLKRAQRVKDRLAGHPDRPQDQ